jgi:phage gp46-like protein
MRDIALIPNGEFGFDVAVKAGDLAADEGLETAVLLSLFTDTRAEDSELPPGIVDKRGYWGDTISDVPGDSWGSKLWLLAREPKNLATLAKAEEYAKASLDWMKSDGLADDIRATAEFLGDSAIKIAIDVIKAEARSRFEATWDGQLAKRS